MARARTIQNASRPCRGHRALLEHYLSIDYDQRDAFRILVGLFVRRAVAHRVGIENGDICFQTFSNDAAIQQSEPLRRERGHLPDRVFESDDLQLTNVTAEHT